MQYIGQVGSYIALLPLTEEVNSESTSQEYICTVQVYENALAIHFLKTIVINFTTVCYLIVDPKKKNTLKSLNSFNSMIVITICGDSSLFKAVFASGAY